MLTNRISYYLLPVSAIQYMVDEFRNRRSLIIDLLRTIPGLTVNEPQGAFYVFPDVSYYFGKSIQGQLIENADDFALFLLEHAHVATVSGTAFGAPDCLRISYAASEAQIREALSRMAKVLG